MNQPRWLRNVRPYGLAAQDLLLENGNWAFARPAAPPSGAQPATPPREPMALDIQAVTLRDWVVTAGGEGFAVPRASITGA